MNRSIQKKLNRYTRKIHFWGSIAIALPVVIVIVSGLLLQLKKELPWVQPPSQKGSAYQLALTFDQILSISKSSTKAGILSWQDIKRLDVRPKKGIIKIQTNNNWELQLDAGSGTILSEKYRRSDIIESIHDGSFFHDHARLWLFLPAAIVLLFLWLTGLYLFCVTLIHRRRSHKKAKHGH